MMRQHVMGVAVILATLVLDQVSKYIFLYEIPLGGQTIELLPVLNLTMVWNPGVSFGLFPAESEAGRWVLIAIALAIAAYVGWWMWHSTGRWLRLCQGMVIGGALGNVIDRLLYGAVFDFIDFYVGNWHWPVFNVADAAISIGVVGLLLDSLREARHDRVSKSEEDINV